MNLTQGKPDKVTKDDKIKILKYIYSIQFNSYLAQLEEVEVVVSHIFRIIKFTYNTRMLYFIRFCMVSGGMVWLSYIIIKEFFCSKNLKTSENK